MNKVLNNIGYIYKITNNINQKIYIGQTKQDYNMRFIQHKSHARTGHSNHKLARAIRKYGEENFSVECVEICTYEKLDEREQYWIKFYNSIKNGYNTSAGGVSGTVYYELDNQEKIIEYYYSCHNKAQTCKNFNITDYKLRQLLLKNNLPTDFSNYGKHISKAVKVIELNKIFSSETELAKFFIDNKICETQKIECALARVNHGLKNHKKVYGYTLEEVI